MWLVGSQQLSRGLQGPGGALARGGMVGPSLGGLAQLASGGLNGLAQAAQVGGAANAAAAAGVCILAI